MNARQRINQYYATISLVFAAYVGLVANSWLVFGIAAGVLLVLQLIGGTIRLGGRRVLHPSRFRTRTRSWS